MRGPFVRWLDRQASPVKPAVARGFADFTLDDIAPGLAGAVHELEILNEFSKERKRAHAKHAATSAESAHPFDHKRMTILTEEVGEVATELNDRDHAYGYELERREAEANIRKELVQCGAMVLSWISAIDGHQL